jgi:hypothetical protein
MLRRAGVSGARLDRGSDEAVGASTGSAKQNTIDLQSKMRANYNARPCDGERKAAVPRTMASNGKNKAQNNGNSRKSGRVLTHRLVISTAHENNRPPPRGAGRGFPSLEFQP